MEVAVYSDFQIQIHLFRYSIQLFLKRLSFLRFTFKDFKLNWMRMQFKFKLMENRRIFINTII